MSDDLLAMARNLAWKIIAVSASSAVATLCGIYFIIEMSVGSIHKRIDDTNGSISSLRVELQREMSLRLGQKISYSDIIDSLDGNEYEIVKRSEANTGRIISEAHAFVSNELPPILIARQDTKAGGIFYNYKGRLYNESGESLNPRFLRNPTIGGKFRSGFGPRRNPISGKEALHAGADWSGPRGTPVVATADGKVIEAGWKGVYGRQVSIDHGDGLQTSYSHLSSITPSIEKGTEVSQGDIIGAIGSTGLTTGSIVHYELIKDGIKIDPLGDNLNERQFLSNRDFLTFQQFISSPQIAKIKERLG